MSPKSFTFKLTVPRDPQVSAIVADVAGHAVVYAALDAASGADFVARVTAAVAPAITAPGQPLQIVVTGTDTTVTFAFDAESVSAQHSA